MYFSLFVFKDTGICLISELYTQFKKPTEKERSQKIEAENLSYFIFFLLNRIFKLGKRAEALSESYVRN